MSAPAERSDVGRAAIAVVALCFAFNFVARGVADAFTAFVLPLEAEFGWARQSVTGVFALYMLTAGLGAPLAGLAFDRLGPRAVYGGGIALIATGAWLSGRIDALWQLYLSAGVLIGFGGAALGMVSATTLIARWHRRHLSKAIAVAYAGFGSGILVVLPIVQWLIGQHGWRFAYQALGIGVALVWPVCMLLPWRMLAAGSSEGVGGASRTDRATDSPRQGPTLSDALRMPVYWRLVQVFMCTSLSSYLVTPQIVAFLVEAGYPPITAASAYGTSGLLASVGLIASGWLVGRLGYARTALMSYTSTAIGVALLLLASYLPVLPVLIAHVLFFGIVQGSRGPIVSTLSSRIFAGRSAGTIYGTVFASMSIGGAIGAYAGGVLHDLTGGYRVLFLLSLVAIACAAAPFRGEAAILRAAGVR